MHKKYGYAMPDAHIASKYFDMVHFDWLEADVIVYKEYSRSPIHTSEGDIKTLCDMYLQSTKKGIRVFIEHTDKVDFSLY